jgi:hypothetical protein
MTIFISKKTFNKIYNNYDLIQKEIKKHNKKFNEKIDENCKDCYVFNSNKDAKYFFNLNQEIKKKEKKIEKLKEKIIYLNLGIDVKTIKFGSTLFQELQNFYYSKATLEQKDIIFYLEDVEKINLNLETKFLYDRDFGSDY